MPGFLTLAHSHNVSYADCHIWLRDWTEGEGAFRVWIQQKIGCNQNFCIQRYNPLNILRVSELLQMSELVLIPSTASAVLQTTC